MVRSLRVQSQQLLTKGEVLKDEVLPGMESTDHPTEEMSERRDHSKNLSGKVRIELFAKSFILRVYDVLARHTRREITNQPGGANRPPPDHGSPMNEALFPSATLL
jgi:hypothetical protein